MLILDDVHEHLGKRPKLNEETESKSTGTIRSISVEKRGPVDR